MRPSGAKVRLRDEMGAFPAPVGEAGEALAAVAPGERLRLAWRRERPHLIPEPHLGA